MLNPLEIIALSRDRYEERLREAERDHAFDRAVGLFVRAALTAAKGRIAAPLGALIHKALHEFQHAADWRPEPSSK